MGIPKNFYPQAYLAIEKRDGQQARFSRVSEETFEFRGPAFKIVRAKNQLNL